MISSVISSAFSGMAAQQARMDAIAGNIANGDTPGTTRKSVEMTTGPGGGVKAVTRDAPAGTNQGVDPASEMIDMIDTKMAYEANVAVMEAGMDMWDMLMLAVDPEHKAPAENR